MPNARCQLDPAITRHAAGDFQFPLGVYPVEPASPKAGYTSAFESADGGPGADGEFEEWPDRYVFDIVVSASRVRALCRALIGLLPLRVFPILDVLGNDAYREIDPYVSYDLLGLDQFMDSVRAYADFLFEDGLVGFGAMSEEPFCYFFLDEHKIATVRVEPAVKERLEKILEAFDLHETADAAGVDATAHEHRSILLAPDDRPDLLSPPEIVERLRDRWRLLLNTDPDRNLDEEGKDLGTTAWRCVVRFDADDDRPPGYGEAIVAAECLRDAEECAIEAVERLPEARNYLRNTPPKPEPDQPHAAEPSDAWTEAVPVASDRLTLDTLNELLSSGSKKKVRPVSDLDPGKVYLAIWLGPG
ncbi:MAG: hypothetical protein FJ255_12860 [Phycisphaerae bacterium]|nr:hypothetical protein [Phycisphaerae bacterium]